MGFSRTVISAVINGISTKVIGLPVGKAPGLGYLFYAQNANAPTLYSFDKDGFVYPSTDRESSVSVEEQGWMDRYNSDRRKMIDADRQALDNFLRDTFPKTWKDVQPKIDQATNTNYRTGLAPPSPRDPLAIDLDGDGIETVGVVGGSPILFDHNADGIRTGTGWVSADDAWLVLDRDGNGLIDTGRELFGVDTLLSGTPGVDAVYASTGFQALGTLNSSGDGVFNASDAAFGAVRLWQDLNQDGVSQAGELFTLAQKNILSIGLVPTTSTVNLGNGNTVTGQVVVTRTNGSTTQIDSVSVAADSTAGNLNLANNPFYRAFSTSVPLTAAALALPEMQGSGAVRDLREALSLGNSASAALVSAVQAFAQGSSRDAQQASLDELLRTWAATEAIADRFTIQPVGAETRCFVVTGSTDTALQAKLVRIIPVLEVFNGVTVDESGWASTVSTVNNVQVRTYTLAAEQAASMQASYDSLRTSVYSGLVVHTRLKKFLASLGSRDISDNDFVWRMAA